MKINDEIINNGEGNVATVIVNWNNFEDTIACLNSLKVLKYSNNTIFVVDNGSTNNSYQELSFYKDSNPDLSFSLLKSTENLGFSGGNNYAISKILDKDYQYVWLLNNDTEVTEDALSQLVLSLYKNSDVGAVGSKILYYTNHFIDSAGGRIDSKTGQGYSIGHNERDDGQYDNLTDVDYISGCSMLVRVDIIKSLGSLEDGFFLYYEDSDWGLRIRSGGWRVIQNQKSIIFHKAGSSTGGDYTSPFLLYYNIRNRYIMTLRNHEYFSFWGPRLYLFYRSLHLLINAIMKKDQKLLRCKYIIMAVYHALCKKLGKLL